MIDNPTYEEEKQYGMLIHIIILAATFFSGGTLGAICAFITYFYYKNKNNFLKEVAADSLNIQLSSLIYGVILLIAGSVTGVLTFTGSGKAFALTIIFFILFFALGLYVLIAHVMCALKAKNGELYRPPLMIKIIK